MADTTFEGRALCQDDVGRGCLFETTSEFNATVPDMISSAVGLLAAPVWLFGHFLIMSAQRGRKRNEERLPAWVTWCLLPHCVADVLSCVGAALASQLFPQIVFAALVLTLHSSVALVFIVRHAVCRRTDNDLRSEWTVKASHAVKRCGGCLLPVCPVTVFLVLSVVCTDAAVARDVKLRQMASSYLSESSTKLSWREVCGEVLGGVACVGHWVASTYEVTRMYKSSARQNVGKALGGVGLLAAGNTAYLVTVLWRRDTPWLRALPWTLTRSGLLGINTGMLIQLWRKTRLKTGTHQSQKHGGYSALSSSSGSDAQAESDVLWDSRWRTKLRTGPSAVHYHKVQPITPPFADGSRWLSEGRSLQPASRNMPYDLVQSTETSCSRTADQDTELEFELLRSPADEQGGQGPSLLPSTPTPTYHQLLAHLTPLTPEARQHRVVQWVAKSSPDDDDAGHVAAHFGGREAFRQHSGSFSQTKTSSKCLSRPGLHESRSRKNSAIF